MAFDEMRVFMESARDIHLKCADIRERAQSLEASVHRITARLDGMPVSGGADRNALLAALADAHGRLLQDLADEEQRKTEIAAFIDRIQTSAAGRAILRRRYLHYETWKGVRRWMAAHGMSYSAQSVYRLHGEALRAARIQWDREHERRKDHE